MKESNKVSLWTIKQEKLLWYKLNKSIKSNGKYSSVKPYIYDSCRLVFMPRLITPLGRLRMLINQIRHSHYPDNL